MANAVGVLKHELRRCGSLVLRAADTHRVPAGGALAVDRDRFAAHITAELQTHPHITIERRPVTVLPPERPCVIATGPLTSDDLAASLETAVGHGALAYYDAIAPIVTAESINWNRVFCQSRFDRADSGEPGDAEAYVNCPFEKDGYLAFVEVLLEADRVRARDFEQIPCFEGCLPVEVMAGRGPMTLAFGPMKPTGLRDPRTGRRPYAVVQLRPEDRARTAFNLVGFQTRLTQGEQKRVFRTIPGLEDAVFERMGAIHRNTFVDAPRVLDEHLQVRALPGVYLAGQITGVEGYVESTACGLLCGRILADRLAGRPAQLPPETTSLGGLLGHLRRERKPFQPSNITWSHVPPVEERLRKTDRKTALAARALRDLDAWLETAG
jgi:methylenetetrahydrofolate--tRNA-(uracil-5-)-methyltransferase